MRIVSLLENTTERSDVSVEHGLSLYIEARGQRILFDMGQTDLFCRNAAVLGIDLSLVDVAVISHGHYDHGGGLRKFLEINSRADVYVREDAFSPHFNGEEKYIGLDTSLQDCPRLILTGDECAVCDGITLLSCNGRERKYPPIPSGLTERTCRGFIPDLFLHEQYMLIEEEGRRILFSGCSHKGVTDIMGWLVPDVLIGGFHYSKLPADDSLRERALVLASFPTEYYTCHCTGREQYEFAKEYIPRLHYLSCGQDIAI